MQKSAAADSSSQESGIVFTQQRNKKYSQLQNKEKYAQGVMSGKWEVYSDIFRTRRESLGGKGELHLQEMWDSLVVMDQAGFDEAERMF